MRLPQEAIARVEELLAAYADGKYQEPRWPKLPAERHAAAAVRHGAAFTRELEDDESGRSHLLHMAARALFAVAQEDEQGRNPPDPLGGAVALLAEVQKLLTVLDVGGWSPFQSIRTEVRDIATRLERLHRAQRAAQDGGISWECGNSDQVA